MKSAKEWVKENTQSGAFDQVISMKEAEALVQEIQKDCVSCPEWLDCGRRECTVGVRELTQKFIVEAKTAADMEPECALDWNFCPWCALPNYAKLRKCPPSSTPA